jgi:glutathione S-transferase
MTRILWGIGTPRTLRPLWALEELGLQYEHRKIGSRGDSMKDPEFRELGKRQKIPLYQDDQVEISDSADILTYLADLYGGDVMPMPAPGTSERAILMNRCSFVMTEIDARLDTIRLHGDPPIGLSDIHGKAPNAVETARKYVGNSLLEASRWLDDRRPYVMGEYFGTSDILLTTCLIWAVMCDVNLSRQLAAYNHRLTSRPALKVAMRRNWLSKALSGIDRGAAR